MFAFVSRRRFRALFLALLLGALIPAFSSASDPDINEVDTDEIMRQIRKKYKKSAKKYKSLAGKIEKRIEKALEESAVIDHPGLKLIEELTEAALAESAKKKNSEEIQRLLKAYPWDKVLELETGLQDGSDREIPDHKNGFIHLGRVPDPLPGHPELMINQYLYGFREVVGWQYRVKKGKGSVFLGREKKKERPVMETALPPWESIRVYLDGMKPETVLFAIPWLTHRIHSRLVDLRKAESGGPSTMDEMLAFLDSKWNGFYFANPCTGKDEPFIQPVHALFTEKKGFVTLFPDAGPLALRGDIPFVSLRTYQAYGEIFMNKRVDVILFIRDEAEAEEVRGRFFEESIYLARYKSLIDLIVRAVLAPNLRYPAYLYSFDFPENKWDKLESRSFDRALDVPRKHALVLWAFAEKDPLKLADCLHENLLGKASHRFAENVSLPVEFTLWGREKERDMLEAISKRIKDKEGGEEWEKEFSPFPEYMLDKGTVHSDYLAASYLAFHGQVSRIIREVARQCVLEEIGDKWLVTKK